MSDVQVALAAGAVWLGCSASVSIPWWFAGLVLALGVGAYRSSLVVAGALLAGLSAGAFADAAYEPLAAQQFEGVVQIISLPEVRTFSERVEVRLPSGSRVVMSVSPGAGSIRSARAGEQYYVSGSIRPVEGNGWERSRHLVGRMTARSVRRVGDGAVHWRMAAKLQGVVESAARLLPDRSDALYNGLVTGDDRGQGAGQRSVFRSVGLSHVLAVSGQNVAFVLVILHLLLGSVPGWARPPLVCAGLGVFALATQLEPSVLRATVTAGIGYWAVASGRRTSGARLLAVAVGALLLVDPMLTQSVGFQLSVLASLGILVVGPVLSARLPGRAWIRVPVAVAMSAQLLVSPLLIARFGSISMVSIPANVLVGWAVGLVMIWGMSVGLVAGLIGGPMGAMLVSPVRPLLWWIDAVAGFAASVPSSSIDAQVALLGLALAGVLAVVSAPLRRITLVATFVMVLVFGQPHRLPVQRLAGGGVLVGDRLGGTVLVVHPGADDRLVGGVVDARPGVIDVVVVTGGNRSMSVIVREIATVVDVGEVLAPPQHTVVGARRVLERTVIPSGVGPVTVELESDKRLNVVIAGMPSEPDRTQAGR